MIDKINISSVNSGKTPSRQEPSFKGALDIVVTPLQWLEQYPMINVAFLDVSTAIGPRTYEEGKVNLYGGFEAFRRESSGLIVNCMTPSLIVLGIAVGIQKFIMGEGSQMANCWANEDTINLVTKYWEKAEGKTVKEKVSNTIRKILEETEGIDGDKLKSFKGMNFEESIEKLTENVLNQKFSKKEVKAAYKAIVEKTHISENIKIKGHGNEFFSQNLGSVVENTPKILRELISGRFANAEIFASKAKNLLTSKSLLGLGVIIPLAISMQPLNRWITAKTSGKNGAPIYKDFGEVENRKLTPKEETDLFKQKIISVGLMVGTVLLSMMKLPNMKMLKDLSQFKGIFPTVEMARVIFTATCASRLMFSEDKNDLVRSTIRDIATFASFYFIGDYVAKATASLIQKLKPEIKLINVLKEPPAKNANILKKFWHWAKGTALKSSDEVYGLTAEATKYAKKMRSVCQLANIAFSLAALGIMIPKIYIANTNKEYEKELKAHKTKKKAA